jgi:hypothetical protein
MAITSIFLRSLEKFSLSPQSLLRDDLMMRSGALLWRRAEAASSELMVCLKKDAHDMQWF